MHDRCEVWLTGPMVCFGCGFDEGTHIWLEGSEPVQCPECREHLCVPVEEENAEA